MDRLKKWAIVPGFFLFMVGCTSYSSLTMDVLKPAEINIPVEIASVVIVDNAHPLSPGDSNVVHTLEFPGRKFLVDSIVSDDFGDYAIKSLAESLKARQFFDSVHVVEEPYNAKEDGSPMKPLSSFVKDTLCRYYDAQAVISLDHYSYSTSTKVTQESMGYYFTLDARPNTYWKIHNCISGELLNMHLQQDTIFWDSGGQTISSYEDSLPDLELALNEAAIYSGAQYADYIAPKWMQENRIYYKNGHPLFSEASVLVSQGNWETATRIWYKAFEENEGKIEARAAFNLALGKEALDEIEEALAWAYTSVQKYESLGGFSFSGEEQKLARRYYVKLAQRLQEKKKIDEQYGVD